MKSSRVHIPKVKSLFLMSSTALSLCASCGSEEPMDEQIVAVENNLLPPVLIAGEPAYTLQERMEYHHIPGFSIAVINDFEIEWIKSYGVSDAETGTPVNDSTLFGVGSLSKGVSAMAILTLVDAGRLTLDEDVSDRLVSWKWPESELTANSKVTLRRLLNHTGGFAQGGNPGNYPEAMPSLLETMSGQAGALVAEPGSQYIYSNIGYTIAQILAMDISGLSFTDFTRQTVLDPLGMRHSTFEQPLPAEKILNAAAGHSPLGVPNRVKRYAYPRLAPAGLWATASDYSKFVIEIQKSVHGKSNRVLSPELAKAMISPHDTDIYGLGVFLRGNAEGKYFGHFGDVQGFIGGFAAHRTDGYGAVIMVNNGAGIPFCREVVQSIAKVYGWDDYLPEEHTAIALDPSLMEQYAGRYRAGSDSAFTVYQQNGQLFLRAFDTAGTRLYALSPDTVITKDRIGQIVFTPDPDGTGYVATHHFADNIGRMLGEPIRSIRMEDDETIPSELLTAGKTDEALEEYRRIKAENPDDPFVSENRFNSLGYGFLNAGDVERAIAAFAINIALYPESANCYDSMGEALLERGDKPEALRCYRQALQLNPESSNARQIVERLEAEGVVSR